MRELKITQSVTDRSSRSISHYFNEVSKIDMVTADEEVVLAQKIRDGDQRALQRLISANLRFVVSVAKQYQNYGIPLSDLINEGNIGLIKAAKRFDETKGFKFISYAVWWIRQCIMTAIANNARMVRIPQNRSEQLQKLKKLDNKLEQELERMPTDGELADAAGVSEAEVRMISPFNHRARSIDAPISENSDTTRADFLGDGESAGTNHLVIEDSLRTDLDRALSMLTMKEKTIICMAFGIGYPTALSLYEISRELSLSPERIRQLRNIALKKIRRSPFSGQLREYLDLEEV